MAFTPKLTVFSIKYVAPTDRTAQDEALAANTKHLTVRSHDPPMQS